MRIAARDDPLRDFAYVAHVGASAQRSLLAPDIPTFAEAGLPDLIVEKWISIAGSVKRNPSTSLCATPRK